MILFFGEFDSKSHKILDEKYGNYRLLIAGADNFNGEYPRLAKELGVEARVDFLGHRNDIELLDTNRSLKMIAVHGPLGLTLKSIGKLTANNLNRHLAPTKTRQTRLTHKALFYRLNNCRNFFCR